jgi:hypothetical protein
MKHLFSLISAISFGFLSAPLNHTAYDRHLGEFDGAKKLKPKSAFPILTKNTLPAKSRFSKGPEGFYL